MKLLRYLSNLGYGTRREVGQLFRQRRVTAADGTPLREDDKVPHGDVRVDGEPLDPPPGVVLMLHKPVGYVCSTADANPLVYELLPARFARRAPVIAPVGRLDRDTSGLLILTDDGQVNHRIASPKHHLPRTYEATLADPLRGDEAELFASGEFMLRGETVPLKPAVLEVLTPRHVRVTVTEGRYHQVRRMFAAAGNRVDTLHRTGIGGLTLGDLAPGEWRLLTDAELRDRLNVQR